ncbi:MAG: hypothetical protein ABI175_07635 [Polyangiales bacterium]
MNPGYQQGPQAPGGYQQPAPQQQYSAPMGPTGGAVKKGPPLVLIAGALLGIFILTNWLIGAFKIDGDGARFLTHTGAAAGTAGLGIIMLLAFSRLTEKDKEHPGSWSLALIVCVLAIAIVASATLAHLR